MLSTRKFLIWSAEIALVLVILIMLAAMWLPAYIGGTPERFAAPPQPRGAP